MIYSFMVKFYWLYKQTYNIELYTIHILTMQSDVKSPSRDEQPASLPKQKSAQLEKKAPQQSNLVDLIKSHAMIKVLTHQKVDILRKYLEEQQRGKVNKNLRATCKSFVDKVQPPLLQLLTEMTLRQLTIFLRNQKKMDDQKLRKLSRIVTEWQEQNPRSPSWMGPMRRFFQDQKNRELARNKKKKLGF